MTWRKCVRTTNGLSQVGWIRLPDWSLQNRPARWLETLVSVAKCRVPSFEMLVSLWLLCLMNFSIFISVQCEPKLVHVGKTFVGVQTEMNWTAHYHFWHPFL